MSTTSVIIVNWNGGVTLCECLEGLRHQVYKPYSVILVDNGSQDVHIDFYRSRFPEITCIPLAENLGFCKANNCALRNIETDYVALLNNDAVPHSHWLKNLVQALDEEPNASFAASKMLFRDNPELIDRCGDAYTTAGVGLLRGRGKQASCYNKKEWIFGACAGAALYRTSMLRHIGYFDEDFFLLYEDVDLSFRAQLKGYKCLYIPEAIVYHKGSGSIGHDSSISVYYGHRNLEWVYIQNMPRWLMLRTIFPHLIYNIVAFLYFVACGRGYDLMRAKKDALKGMKRALYKRREVQSSKTVDDNYIWGLFEKEKLYQRLIGRLR